MLLLRFINTFYRPHLPSPANAGEELAMCIFKFFLRLFFCVYNFLCILILFLKFKFLIKMKKICLLVSAVLLFDVGVGFAYSPAFSYEEEFSLERAFAVRAKRLSSGSVNRHGLREGGRQMFSSEGDFEVYLDAYYLLGDVVGKARAKIVKAFEEAGYSTAKSDEGFCMTGSEGEPFVLSLDQQLDVPDYRRGGLRNDLKYFKHIGQTSPTFFLRKIHSIYKEIPEWLWPLVEECDRDGDDVSKRFASIIRRLVAEKRCLNW